MAKRFIGHEMEVSQLPWIQQQLMLKVSGGVPGPPALSRVTHRDVCQCLDAASLGSLCLIRALSGSPF